MDWKVGTYLVYLAISIGLTVWVARTLRHHGQVFLEDALVEERLALSVNRLLVVGFYLINLGYVAVALKISETLTDASQSIEALATKVGLVLLVLGALHFFNMFVLSRYRQRRRLDQAPPPVGPDRMVPVAAVPTYGPVPPMVQQPPR